MFKSSKVRQYTKVLVSNKFGGKAKKGTESE